MTLEQFLDTLNNDQPGPQMSDLLAALWWQANNDWERAHSIVQELDSKEARWIHAYLHRFEGDKSNARYWYSRAHRTMPAQSFDAEWEEIVSELLKSV